VTARRTSTRPSTRAQSHPILRSIEPGEGWSWCMIDEVAFT
jgi:hypothetical protein